MRQDGRRRRLVSALELGVIGALAYLPLLLTRPGVVSSDTKQYLYLDPGRFVRQVASMWDPAFAGGMVTHQYIGYLLPQGPFYLFCSALQIPVWVSQRLWLGSLLYLAGVGVRYAMRTLGLSGRGPLVAGVVYELSPYAMQYIERISAILMPWAGLGWMLGFTVLALRKGGWKYPALFAIVVALAGGINATSLIYAGIAPLLWILFELVARREVPRRRVAWTTAKIGLLSLGVSLWWLVGLAVESAFGLNVLRYTETLPAIAGTSAASEVTRGLGYWYFYGTDRLGPWLSSSTEYTQNVGLLAVSYLLPALGFLGAFVCRWRARAYFVVLALVGLVLSVGAHPYDHPSAMGAVLKSVMNNTTTGFAFRSSDRATPLVVLSLAAFLGAGVSALHQRQSSYAAWLPAGLCVAVAVANATPLMTGLAVDPHFDRSSALPAYFAPAARYLDSKGDATRVLIEPGDNWADYTWGNTIDPVWSGILTRPSMQRQQLIDGSAQTADLLSAFDLTLQQGTYEPSTLAPVARLLSAGDVVLESDYKYWHYHTPEPRPTWELFDPPPAGIGRPAMFGPRRPIEPPLSDATLDAQALSSPPGAPWPPPLAVFPVSRARPIYRAEPAQAPLVLDGSGSGIVAAAAAGLLADDPTIVYSQSLDSKMLLNEGIARGAVLVLTDTNRKELRRWSSVTDNIGETLPAGPLQESADPTAQPLPLFTSVSDSGETIATYSDAHYVAASSYGNPIDFTPEDRPYMAFDGNRSTAWLAGAFSSASGQWLQVGLTHRVRTGSLALLQAYPEDTERWITRVTVTFDGGRPLVASLGADSRGGGGEMLHFPPRSFSTLRITVDRTQRRGAKDVAGPIGLAEVGIPGVNLSETMQLPSDLLRAAGHASLGHRLILLLTRDRVGPYPPRSDPEPFMSRSLWLPATRRFAIAGTARLSPLVSDGTVDGILAGHDALGGSVATSSGRLAGDLDARAVFAFDGNPSTAWTSPFDASPEAGVWVQAALPHAVTFDRLLMQVVADKRHSVPTWIRITTNRGGQDVVKLPAITSRPRPGATASVQLSFPRLTGSTVRIAVIAEQPLSTIDWFRQAPSTLPLAIADIEIPGVRLAAESPAADIPKVCRGGLMTMDGRPVWLEISGTVAAAESGGPLSVSGCGPDAAGVPLQAGVNHLETRSGALSGINLDRLVLDSAPGGGASMLLSDGEPYPVLGTTSSPGAPALAAPTVQVRKADATSATLRVDGATKPFWLVLGESFDKGWVAQIAGGRSLGTSSLIDGYANGWYVVPGRRKDLTVDLVWQPQREVDVAIAVSLVAVLCCIALATEVSRRGRRQRRRGRHARHPPDTRGERRNREGPDSASETRMDYVARFSLPWSKEGRQTSLGGGSAIAAGVGLAALLLIPEPSAAPVAVALTATTFLSARTAWSRSLLPLIAVSALFGAGALTVLGQIANRFPPGSAWPANFQSASILVLVAFVALGADAAAVAARRRRASRRTHAPR